MNLNPIAAIVKPIATGITKIFTKKQDVKIAMTKARNGQVMSDKEWEMISKAAESGSWKDEYITIIVTFPLLLMYYGVLTDPNYTIFEASQIMMDKFNAFDTSNGYGQLLWVTVLAALSIKAVKN